MRIIYIETEELNSRKFIAVVKWKQKWLLICYLHLNSNTYVSLTVLLLWSAQVCTPLSDIGHSA